MALSSGPFGYNRFQGLDDLYLQERLYWEQKLREKKEDKKDKDDKKDDKKKDKEPRWQDSDGDGKWYEKGEDVKEDCGGGKCPPDCKCEDCSSKKKKAMKEGAMPSSIASGKFGPAPNKTKTPASISSGKFGPAPKVKATGSLTSGKFGAPVKEEITVGDVSDYLIERGYVNNDVSAEVFINNMSAEWLEQIVDELAD